MLDLGSTMNRETRIHTRFAFLFRSLFHHIHRWLAIQVPPVKFYEEAVHCWNFFVGEHRAQIYKGVLEATFPVIDPLVVSSESDEVMKAIRAETESASALRELRSFREALQTCNWGHDFGHVAPLPTVFQEVLAPAARARITEAANGMEKLSEGELRTFPLVVVYFDEVQTLWETFVTKPNSERPQTLYNVLLSVFADIRKEGLFGVFLSTNLYMGDVAPPAQLSPPAQFSPSARQHITYTQPAPFTELPFDCAPSLPLDVAALKVEDLPTVRFMAQFGRPL